VNFIPDAPAGLREMVRVTRAGGVVAGWVWDYAGEMRLLRAFWDAAGHVDPAGAAAHDEARMPWSGEGELAALWEETGLMRVRSTALRARARYASFEELWEPFEAGVGPAGAYTVGLGDEQRRALRAALAQRLDAHGEPFELTARAWAVAGVVA
jgi:hypothetical protein